MEQSNIFAALKTVLLSVSMARVTSVSFEIKNIWKRKEKLLGKIEESLREIEDLAKRTNNTELLEIINKQIEI